MSATESVIYFVQAADGTGPIKVGFSANLENRLAAYRLHSPVKVRLLARVPGGRDLESALHRALSEDHSHGEWHHPSPRLLGLLADIERAHSMFGAYRSVCRFVGWPDPRKPSARQRVVVGLFAAKLLAGGIPDSALKDGGR